ncbi:hypothetical protein SAMN05892883_2769 [Jatrophihabitans sp. GAS493]|nr:hypothetical protein SAMN05892883_2769 [Jatrophihabitans sp. GAS493]
MFTSLNVRVTAMSPSSPRSSTSRVPAAPAVSVPLVVSRSSSTPSSPASPSSSAFCSAPSSVTSSPRCSTASAVPPTSPTSASTPSASARSQGRDPTLLAMTRRPASSVAADTTRGGGGTHGPRSPWVLLLHTPRGSSRWPPPGRRGPVLFAEPETIVEAIDMSTLLRADTRRLHRPARTIEVAVTHSRYRAGRDTYGKGRQQSASVREQAGLEGAHPGDRPAVPDVVADPPASSAHGVGNSWCCGVDGDHAETGESSVAHTGT